MVVVILAEELDRTLGMTLGVLNKCGFKTMLVESQGLERISRERVIILGKHPWKKNGGGTYCRRRFAFFTYQGFRAVGYADGAKIDPIWWRDLHCKLSRLAKDSKLEGKTVFALERLRKMGL